MPVAYEAARELLDVTFAQAEQDLLEGRTPSIPVGLRNDFDTISRSSMQAYREVLVGCTIARIQDKGINVRLPYIGHGPKAYNGRTLDERVVNPFFQGNRIPSSKGPFLSTFRRSVRACPG